MAKHDAVQRTTTATIPVVEEVLQVGRREVETGEAVRVRKQVEEAEVELDEILVREVVETERVPVGRVIDGPMAPRHEGEVLVVPVVEERLVLHKQLVLVEELRITRRREERPAGLAPVRLRREQVVVERRDPATGQWRAEEPVAEPPSGPGPPPQS
ncbi:DUF2382 domain-containing protein [Ramlibacter tataouinensis]|uniref:DUF2382 domain-containing protein n=1 Tax=Ramlibacter tataouinensis (strain ATCC BAA-407 / DSM 14655 / LMG 21543 / TTB310) TaxID=365046 RepID=F5XYI7_RAMTT|nr:DUF2382 domain-containing protein [Ramlibacter tataouinensis]AEG93163.1 hypothetical protein Rta_20700 [Ramlibacter tataouinensis TTB310]